MRWATTRRCAALTTWHVPRLGTWGNGGSGRSDTGCECIDTGRTIRPHRPTAEYGRLRWPAWLGGDAGAASGPAGRRGRVVERCRPTPGLAWALSLIHISEPTRLGM